MAHSNTQRLIGYWRDRRGAAAAPSRASIDPGDFVEMLAQVFILGRRGQGQYHFRLVGGLVSELHRRDLRGEDFLTLWDRFDRLPLQTAMESARRRPEPVVISCDAHAPVGTSIGMEMVLAPLTGINGEIDRYLGLYQPVSAVARLRGLPIRQLTLRSLDLDVDAAATHLRLAAIDGRRIA